MQRKLYALALLVVTVLAIIVAVGVAFPYFLGRKDDIIIEVSTDKLVYQTNETIQICLKIINPSNSTILLGFTSSYQVDYKIIQKSKVIYHWFDGRGALTVLTQIAIPAHDMVVEYFQHRPQDYFLKPGMYIVHGFLDPFVSVSPNHRNGHYSDCSFIVVSG